MVGMKKILLQALVMFCVYLIVSITPASAIQISIYQQILSGGQTITTGVAEDVTINPADIVSKTIEIYHNPSDYRWEEVQVKVEVVGSDPSYSVEKIYLFKCKNTLPLDCSDYAPVEADSYLSGDKGTFYWNDVSRDRFGNFMTLIKMDHNGQSSWVGFWDTVERTGVQTFVHTQHDVESIDVYAKPGIQPSWIRDFIKEHYMIPSNWVDRSTLNKVDGNLPARMYQLSANQSEMNVPTFQKYSPSGNIIRSISRDYLFAFAEGSLANPVTLFANKLPECGDSSCDLGESPVSCCLDCGCSLEAQECTKSIEYPSGVCHQCGNGALEATENSTTCCADAGCPSGQFCDTSISPPYGKCTNPSCGNHVCETPFEDSRGCPVDCHDTPGASCSDVYGAGSYYDAPSQDCVFPNCGLRGCEPGETKENCCLDCGCTGDNYCNTAEIPKGVCTSPTCGNDRCEPSENYTNCCTDCANCPVDPRVGKPQVCENNVCHLCGNHVPDGPETRENCCQDYGCDAGSVCSVFGNCVPGGQVTLGLTAIPSSIDCSTSGDMNIKARLNNMPNFFNNYEEFYAVAEDRLFQFTCMRIGDEYNCQGDITQLCFDTGQKQMNVTVTISYYEDYADVQSGRLTYKDVSGMLAFNVVGARERVCEKDGYCDYMTGENSENCCYDCPCASGKTCAGNGCVDPNSIQLKLVSAPSRDELNCQSGTGDVQIKLKVEPVPETYRDRFDLKSVSFEYNSVNYSSANGYLSCVAERDDSGYASGVISCSMPIFRFPPCPDTSGQANLDFHVVIGGSGLEERGLNRIVALEYIPGLPNCGNGVPDSGETELNCCHDAGCASGRTCTLNGSCVDDGQIDMTLTMSPTIVDCARVPDPLETEANVRFDAMLTERPENFYGFGYDTYIQDVASGRKHAIGQYCTQSATDNYAYKCEIPFSDYPYCKDPYVWGPEGQEKPHTLNFTTSVSYSRTGSASAVTKKLSELEDFSIKMKDRTCEQNGDCNAEAGENSGNCCTDCPCGDSSVCSGNNCIAGDSVNLVIPAGTVSSVDCTRPRAADMSESFFTFRANVNPLPDSYYDIFMWKLQTATLTYNHPERGLQEYGSSDRFVCSPVQESNVIECSMPVTAFPACPYPPVDNGTQMKFSIGVQGGGYVLSGGKTLEKTFNVNYAQGLPNCGNGNIDEGENQQTCCWDTGCNAGEMCTVERNCVPEDNLGVNISIRPESVDCTASPDTPEGKVVVTATLTERPYTAGYPNTPSIVMLERAYFGIPNKTYDITGFMNPEESADPFSWTFDIPVTNFDPFCWDDGVYNAKFEADISWTLPGTTVSKTLVNQEKTVTVTLPRTGCNCDGAHQPELGERVGECCPDAGCSDSVCGADQNCEAVCTKNLVCAQNTSVGLEIATITPSSIDCRSTTGNVVISARINNEPFMLKPNYPVWYIEYQGQRIGSQYFSCIPVVESPDVSGVSQSCITPTSGLYECTIPIYYFPACGANGTKTLTLIAETKYLDNEQRTHEITLNRDFNVEISHEGYPSCGNMHCQAEFHETEDTCCMDCGCRTDSEICTVDRKCYSAGEFRMGMAPLTYTTECQLEPKEVGKNTVETYFCTFQQPLTLRGSITPPMPWQSQATGASYEWDSKNYNNNILPSEPKSYGWDVSITPFPYTINRFSGDSLSASHKITNVSIVLQVPPLPGQPQGKTMTITSRDAVNIVVVEKKSDGLLELEKSLKDAERANQKARQVTCSILMILGICFACKTLCGTKTETQKSPVTGTTGSGGSTLSNTMSNSGIFSRMNELFGKIGGSGSTIGGIALGLGFYWMAKSMDCESLYGIGILSGTAMCTIPGVSPAVCKGLVGPPPEQGACTIIMKVFDILFMMMDMQTVFMQNQACMMAANSILSHYSPSETAEQRAQRMQSYYQALANCNQQLGQNMQSLAQRWENYGLVGTVGIAFYYNKIDDQHLLGSGATIHSDDSPFIIQYDFPSSTSTQPATQAKITASFQYYWVRTVGETVVSGLQGNAGSTIIIPTTRSGTIQCPVDNYGMNCQGYALKAPVPSTEQLAAAHVTMNDIKLKGSFTITWEPCRSGSTCMTQFSYDSATRAGGQPQGPGTQPGTPGGTGGVGGGSRPVVTGVTISPETVYQNQEITLTATVTDADSGVSGCYVTTGDWYASDASGCGAFQSGTAMYDSGFCWFPMSLSGILSPFTAAYTISGGMSAGSKSLYISCKDDVNFGGVFEKPVSVNPAGVSISGVNRNPSNPTSQETITVTATASSSPYNIKSCRVALGAEDNNVFFEMDASDGSFNSVQEAVTKPIGPLPAGTHSLNVICFDAQGNGGQSGYISFVVSGSQFTQGAENYGGFIRASYTTGGKKYITYQFSETSNEEVLIRFELVSGHWNQKESGDTGDFTGGVTDSRRSKVNSDFNIFSLSAGDINVPPRATSFAVSAVKSGSDRFVTYGENGQEFAKYKLVKRSDSDIYDVNSEGGTQDAWCNVPTESPATVGCTVIAQYNQISHETLRCA